MSKTAGTFQYIKGPPDFFFFPCIEEEESKIATGNRKHKISISEDEKKKSTSPWLQLLVP